MFFFKRRRKKKQPEESVIPVNSVAAGQETEQSQHESAPKIKACFAGSVVSDIGCVRANNEDNYLLGKYINSNSADHSEISVSVSDLSGQWLFAGVFDGMGGGDKGELASQRTAQIFLEACVRLKEGSTKSNVDLLLRNAFLEANNAIVSLQQECNVFGTTGTVLCTNGEEFKIYHLGDSRAYLIREGHLFQLTQDQTLAQMKIDAGLYCDSDPQAEADKHKLTEYIGRDWTRENIRPVESRWISIQEADRALLCSDGLYDMCTDAEIEQILSKSSNIEMQVKQLTDKARRNGGVDNITCIIVALS